MKEVIISKYGEPVSDFDSLMVARSLLEKDKLHISNEMVFDWVRVMIKEGEIDVKNLKVTYVDYYNDQEHVLVCYPNGTLQHWPRGLGDQKMDALSRLLR